MNKKDEVYDRLVDALVHARYAFGERILVKEVATQTGASRQPIMAALGRLAADGFVRIIPQVGCQVVDPDQTAIADFFRMFARMEGLLAELAAERRDDRQLRDLSEAHARIVGLDLTRPGGVKDYIAMNQRFHQVIHEMARSPHLADKQRSNFNMSDFFINHAVGYSSFVPDAMHEHSGIIAALRTRNPATARALAEAHIADVAAAVLSGLGRDTGHPSTLTVASRDRTMV